MRVTWRRNVTNLIMTYLLTRSSMATLKTCFKCGAEKPCTEFYKHPQMGDGLLGKCIECTKHDVRAHRAANDSVREYDRSRAKKPERIAANIKNAKAWRDADPRRNSAHRKLYRAVKAGVIKPHPCWVCGEKAEAHHPDYSAPLDVVWLCALHHRRLHLGK
jgi:hypothetical protein